MSYHKNDHLIINNRNLNGWIKSNTLFSPKLSQPASEIYDAELCVVGAVTVVDCS